jgi:hypothetical protein
MEIINVLTTINDLNCSITVIDTLSLDHWKSKERTRQRGTRGVDDLSNAVIVVIIN